MISQSMKYAIKAYAVRSAQGNTNLTLNELVIAQAIHAFLNSPEYAGAHAHDVAVLIKAAMDGSNELDWVKNIPQIDDHKKDEISAIVNRVNDACDSLGGLASALTTVSGPAICGVSLQ